MTFNLLASVQGMSRYYLFRTNTTYLLCVLTTCIVWVTQAGSFTWPKSCRLLFYTLVLQLQQL